MIKRHFILASCSLLLLTACDQAVRELTKGGTNTGDLKSPGQLNGSSGDSPPQPRKNYDGGWVVGQHMPNPEDIWLECNNPDLFLYWASFTIDERPSHIIDFLGSHYMGIEYEYQDSPWIAVYSRESFDMQWVWAGYLLADSSDETRWLYFDALTNELVQSFYNCSQLE